MIIKSTETREVSAEQLAKSTPKGQIELMIISNKLQAGQRIDLPHQFIVNCAKQEVRSLIFDGFRDSDIDEFVNKVERNWGIRLWKNVFARTWTMEKLK